MQSEMDVLTGSGSSLAGGASAISSPTASLSGTPAAVPQLTNEEKVEVDSRSIYVGNVDYGANAEELEQHFHGYIKPQVNIRKLLFGQIHYTPHYQKF